ILRCLEKDPRDRYRDGDALAYALETFDKPRSNSGRIDAAGMNPMQPMGSARMDSGPRRASGPRNGNGGAPFYDDGNDYLPNGGFNQNPTRAEAAARTMARSGVMSPDEEEEKASPAAGVTTAIIVASVLLLLGVSCFLAFK